MCSLNSLRSLFFMKRNGYGRLFPFKLYHALLITKAFPEAYQYTGVKWVSETIIKVNGAVFASLLGIHSVSGGLFHRQGNFSRHHFEQVLKKDHPELNGSPDIMDVDDLTIMLFIDQENRFTRDTEYNPSASDNIEPNDEMQ